VNNHRFLFTPPVFGSLIQGDHIGILPSSVTTEN